MAPRRDQARHSHGDDGRDVVETRDEHANLGDGGGEEQRPQRLAALRRHAEQVEERDDAVRRDRLQQPRRPWERDVTRAFVLLSCLPFGMSSEHSVAHTKRGFTQKTVARV